MEIRRSGKEYRRNERDVMELLGLRPTKNSGSGWVEKEDGESENVLCQLKSTDAKSIKVVKQDLDTLQYNALVSHKIPVFAIQFLESNDIYLVVKPAVLEDLAKHIKTREAPDEMQYAFYGIDLSSHKDMSTVPSMSVIRSSPRIREELREEQERKYKKKWRSAD